MKNIKNNFKIFLLAIAIVAVWRGVWGLMDIYLFPDNQSLSLILSLVIGIFILYFNDHRLNELVDLNSSVVKEE